MPVNSIGIVGVAFIPMAIRQSIALVFSDRKMETWVMRNAWSGRTLILQTLPPREGLYLPTELMVYVISLPIRCFMRLEAMALTHSQYLRLEVTTLALFSMAPMDYNIRLGRTNKTPAQAQKF